MNIRRFEAVTLIVHRNRKLLTGTDFIEDPINSLQMQICIFIGKVNDFQY